MSKQKRAGNLTNSVNRKTDSLSQDISRHSKKLNNIAKLEKQRDNLLKKRDKQLFNSTPNPNRLPDCDYPPIYDEKNPKIAICTFKNEQYNAKKDKLRKKQEKITKGSGNSGPKKFQCTCVKQPDGQYICGMSEITVIQQNIDSVLNKKNSRQQRKQQLQASLDAVENSLNNFSASSNSRTQAQLEKQAARLRSKISKVDANILKSNTRLNKLQSNKNKLEKEVQRRTDKMNSAENKINKLDQEIAKVAVRQQQLITKAEKFDNKLEIINSKITNLGTQAVQQKQNIDSKFINTMVTNQQVENLLSSVSVKNTRKDAALCGCETDYSPIVIFRTNGTNQQYDNECILRCKEGQQACLTGSCVPAAAIPGIVAQGQRNAAKTFYQSKANTICAQIITCGTDGNTYYSPCDLPSGVRIFQMGKTCAEVNRDAKWEYDRSQLDAMKNIKCNDPNGCVYQLGPKFTYPVPNIQSNVNPQRPNKVCAAPKDQNDPSYNINVNENLFQSPAWPKDINGQPYKIIFYGECNPNATAPFTPAPISDPSPGTSPTRPPWPTVVTPVITNNADIGSGPCFDSWTKAVFTSTTIGNIKGLQSDARRVAGLEDGVTQNIHINHDTKSFYGGNGAGGRGNFVVGETVVFSNFGGGYNGSYTVKRVDGPMTYITCGTGSGGTGGGDGGTVVPSTCFSKWPKGAFLSTSIGTIIGSQSNAKRIADVASNGGDNIRIDLKTLSFGLGMSPGAGGNFIVGETVVISGMGNDLNGTYKVKSISNDQYRSVNLTCV